MPEENVNFIPELITYKAFNRVDQAVLDKILKGTQEDVNNWCNMVESYDEQDYRLDKRIDEFSVHDKVSLLLYKQMLEDPMSSIEDALLTLKQRCANISATDPMYDRLKVAFTQELFQMYLGLSPITEPSRNYAPIISERVLDNAFSSLFICVPVVPIKSIFTLYIISIVNEVLQCVYRAGKSTENPSNVKLEFFWTPGAYKHIKEVIVVDHFSFDAELEFDILRQFIELEFRSFVHHLILGASWDGIQNSWNKKFKILRKASALDEEKLQNFIGNLDRGLVDWVWRAKSIRQHPWHSSILVGGIKSYIDLDSPNDLITTSMKYILQKLNDLGDKDKMVFILPLPDGLVINDMIDFLSKVPSLQEKWDSLLKKVHVLCYVPFPLSSAIEKDLPFYVTPYSHSFLHQKNEKVDRRSLIQRECIRKLTTGALTRLNLEFVETVDWRDYETMMRGLLSIFQIIEREVDDFLKYII